LNGRQFADSQAIIDMLKEKYHVQIDDGLTARQQAEVRTLKVFIEESTQRLVLFVFEHFEFTWIIFV
jgi:glutathione S-transferase